MVDPETEKRWAAEHRKTLRMKERRRRGIRAPEKKPIRTTIGKHPEMKRLRKLREKHPPLTARIKKRTAPRAKRGRKGIVEEVKKRLRGLGKKRQKKTGKRKPRARAPKRRRRKRKR